MKNENQEKSSDTSDTSSVLLCLPPPFKHTKVRQATSTRPLPEEVDEEDTRDVFPLTQKHMLDNSDDDLGDDRDSSDVQITAYVPGRVARRIARKTQDALDTALTSLNDSTIIGGHGKPCVAYPRTSSPVAAAHAASTAAVKPVDAALKPAGASLKPAAPAVKRLLSYGEVLTQGASNCDDMSAKSRLQTYGSTLHALHLETAPVEAYQPRPNVSHVASANHDDDKENFGARKRPRFERAVAIFTDRPAYGETRCRDKYDTLRRDSEFHLEMSTRKHIMLKKYVSISATLQLTFTIIFYSENKIFYCQAILLIY